MFGCYNENYTFLKLYKLLTSGKFAMTFLISFYFIYLEGFILIQIWGSCLLLVLQYEQCREIFDSPIFQVSLSAKCCIQNHKYNQTTESIYKSLFYTHTDMVIPQDRSIFRPFCKIVHRNQICNVLQVIVHDFTKLKVAV